MCGLRSRRPQVVCRKMPFRFAQESYPGTLEASRQLSCFRPSSHIPRSGHCYSRKSYNKLIYTKKMLLLLQVCCEGRGQVIVKITSYKNPFQRDFNGECCDPIFFGCSNGCDAYFKLCVTLSPSKSVYNCNLGKYETDVVGSKASYRFSEDRYKKSFPFNSFQVSALVQESPH